MLFWEYYLFYEVVCEGSHPSNIYKFSKINLNMKVALVIFLIVIGNLALYWVFFGKKKFDQQMAKQMQEAEEKQIPEDISADKMTILK